jgi:hypothetical protein
LLLLATENRVSLQCGQRVVHSTEKVRDGQSNKKLLDQWYAEKMKTVFHERCLEVLKKFEYSFTPSLIVRKMSKRWGSFTKNHGIILNPLLIQPSKQCIDYVITHELCHMKYRNHDKNFFTLLASKMKNWQQVKEQLELRLM